MNAPHFMRAQARVKYGPGERRPGSDTDTDADLVKAVGDLGATIFHPVETCKMGQHGMDVVDEIYVFVEYQAIPIR